MFGFLMFPGFEELDLVGPWEMATCGMPMPAALPA